ncbi:MAG: mucoidy inhibitor MuiA family protein [Myxococcales bacterium]|nr:mucoidy inhibitor MuiA family protein [Myxococcales bacterium]
MSAQALFEQALPIDTKIHNVQIYREKALITRKGSLPVGTKPALPVKQVLRLGPLPLGIDGDSIRVQLQDHPGLFVQEAQLQWQLPNPEASTQERNKLRQELRAKRDKIYNQIARLRQERNALQAMRLETPTPKREQLESWAKLEAPIEGSLALIELIDQEAQDLYKQQTQLEQQANALDQELRELQTKQDAAERQDSERNTPQRHLLIFLHPKQDEEMTSSKKTEDATLWVSYLLEGARWYPTYELRLSQAGQQAEMVLQAQIAQQTGEDWKDVEITLSTADLERSNELPELETLRLGRKEASSKPSWRPPPPETATLFESYEQAQRKLRFALAGTPPTASQNSFSADYPHNELRSEDSPVLFGALASSISTGSFAQQAQEYGGFGGEGGESFDDDYDEYDEYDEYDGDTASSLSKDEVLEMHRNVLGGYRGDEDKQKEYSSSEVERKPLPPKSRGGFLGGLIGAGGGGDTPAASMPPPPMKKKAYASSLSREQAPLRDEEDLDRYADASISMDQGKRRKSSKPSSSNAPYQVAKPKPAPRKAGWLRYESLRLAGPKSSDRGSLVQPDEMEALQEFGFNEQLAAFLGYIDQETSSKRLAQLRALDIPAEARDATQQGGQDGHFAHAYIAQGRFDIPADGGFHKITLRRMEIPIQIVYRSIPLIEPQFYREARLSNKLDIPLLPGPAQVFWDGDFLRTSPLHLVPEGGEIQLGLGIEERLRIARNTQHKEESRGLMGSQQHLHQSINIELRSHLSQAVQVEIIERLPLSSDPKTISILNEHSHPKASPYDQEERQRPIEGGRIWRLELPAQGEQDIIFRYTVALPAKHQLDQGSRRA